MCASLPLRADAIQKQPVHTDAARDLRLSNLRLQGTFTREAATLDFAQGPSFNFLSLGRRRCATRRLLAPGAVPAVRNPVGPRERDVESGGSRPRLVETRVHSPNSRKLGPRTPTAIGRSEPCRCTERDLLHGVLRDFQRHRKAPIELLHPVLKIGRINPLVDLRKENRLLLCRHLVLRRTHPPQQNKKTT